MYASSHELGIVLVNSSQTENHLNDRYSGQYQNVRTFRAIEKLDLDSFRRLEEIECEKGPLPKGAGGDLMDGLIVAADLLNEYCGTKKYKRRVFLITDGERDTQYSKEELRTVIENFNA